MINLLSHLIYHIFVDDNEKSITLESCSRLEFVEFTSVAKYVRAKDMSYCVDSLNAISRSALSREEKQGAVCQYRA